jgi:hypothetical protein
MVFVTCISGQQEGDMAATSPPPQSKHEVALAEIEKGI